MYFSPFLNLNHTFRLGCAVQVSSLRVSLTLWSPVLGMNQSSFPEGKNCTFKFILTFQLEFLNLKSIAFFSPGWHGYHQSSIQLDLEEICQWSKIKRWKTEWQTWERLVGMTTEMTHFARLNIVTVAQEGLRTTHRAQGRRSHRAGSQGQLPKAGENSVHLFLHLASFDWVPPWA